MGLIISDVLRDSARLTCVVDFYSHFLIRLISLIADGCYQ